MEKKSDVGYKKSKKARGRLWRECLTRHRRRIQSTKEKWWEEVDVE